ncbi:MAG: SpoIIE family protein phosphatase, partial [Candidatus Latescibacteria bacterium]|nr:SpoIIE family protein phosphatase [Candidatus Latescibacterota bacterium]
MGHLSAPDRQTDRQMLYLDAGLCFADSFAALKKHPFLFPGASLVTVLLGVASGTLLIGSLYAGLSLMLLKAMDGKQPALSDLFVKINQLPGFFLIVVFGAFATLTGIVLTLAPFVLGNWHTVLLDGQMSYPERLVALIAHLQQVSWGFRLALLSLATGIFYLLVPRVYAGVRCFHMLLLAADQNVPADEAYVLSKKGVQQYGFKQHVLLTLIMFWMAALSLEIFVGLIKPVTGWFGFGLLAFILQPIVLGLFASAYRQTLQAEAHQHELKEEHVMEMQDELKTARDMQLALLPSENPNIEGYELDDVCIPANAVCGDYYSYRWLDDRYFALIAADVSGKAMQAAVTAVRFNEMLRYECKGRTDASEILEGLDESLEDQ